MYVMEDPELEKIRQKQLEELMREKNLDRVVNETPVLELTSATFDNKASKKGKQYSKQPKFIVEQVRKYRNEFKYKVTDKKTANYTHPYLRKKLFLQIKASKTHGTKAGLWSARKAQLLAKKYKQIRFARINVDNSQDIALRYSVQSIPAFIMFRNGEIVNRMVGAVGEPGIHMICKKVLGS